MPQRMPAQPIHPAAWILALVVHLGFWAVLVVGVSWQRHPHEFPLEAELWGDLPKPGEQVTQTAPSPATPPPSLKPPAPAISIAPPLPSAPPVLAPVPDSRVQAAQIALKQRQEAQALNAERQRLEKLRRQKEVEEQLRQERLEAMRESKQDNAQRARLAQENERRAQIARALAAAQVSEVDFYKQAIIRKIRNNTEVPEGVANGTTLEVDLTLLPTGEVLLPVRIVKASGNEGYDQAVIRAIMRSQPLPLPPEPPLRQQFKTTHLQLRHEK